ncbi:MULTISPECIES: ESX secretion-associated protein EspG [unclassified Nocardia]|uniref:ESX secretion-associated protein EspG n=1 Tax=unclassified Nocardia TaxID=2637762 RepID=UPI001CE3F180|nr:MULTISPECIES: ESX secretion-associated protein EspG [unclassified Nocardia]
MTQSLQRFRLTGLEFMAAWTELNEEYVPPPLSYTARARYKDEHDRELRAVRSELRRRWGNWLTPVLEDIARPDIRILVRGLDGVRPDNPRRCIRMLGARKGDRAFLINQEIGETTWHANAFTITEHTAVGLADAIVDALPKAEPGKQPDVVLAAPRTDEIDYEYGQSAVLDSFEDTVVTRAAWFENAPTTLTGTIELEQAYSRFGPRGKVRRFLQWRDLTDDGRYALVPGNPVTAVGADARRMVALINTELAEMVRAIKDERV